MEGPWEEGAEPRRQTTHYASYAPVSSRTTVLRQQPPQSGDFSVLESMLQDQSATPICLPMDFLTAITSDFSEERELGRGGFGVVYKGVLQNGKRIAVKKLSEVTNLDDDQFQKEVTNLFRLKHKNIVQLIGYCAESRWEATETCGKYVMAEVRKRLICFEFINNKSLDKHLPAESHGLDWHMGYEIVRGICSGLHYLHTERKIVHLDIKPQNILLDESMEPKIADFGMSRLFGPQQSRIITQSRGGTCGYMAPEYVDNGLISIKADIFSLGVVIIELMSGGRDYPTTEESHQQFIDYVVGSWRKRMEEAGRYTPLEKYVEQVKTCTLIALMCVKAEPSKRPTAQDIVEKLTDADVSTTDVGPQESGHPSDENYSPSTMRSRATYTIEVAQQLRRPGLAEQTEQVGSPLEHSAGTSEYHEQTEQVGSPLEHSAGTSEYHSLPAWNRAIHTIVVSEQLRRPVPEPDEQQEHGRSPLEGGTGLIDEDQSSSVTTDDQDVPEQIIWCGHEDAQEDAFELLLWQIVSTTENDTAVVKIITLAEVLKQLECLDALRLMYPPCIRDPSAHPRHDVPESYADSMRRSAAARKRLLDMLAHAAAWARWFRGVRDWDCPVHTVLVLILFLLLAWTPCLIIPTFFLYLSAAVSGWTFWYYINGVPQAMFEEFDAGLWSETSPEAVLQSYLQLRETAIGIQEFIGDVASQGERVHALLKWRDGRATVIALVALAALTVVTYAVPRRVLLSVIGIYVMRPPTLRQKEPSALMSFFQRLPSNADVML